MPMEGNGVTLDDLRCHRTDGRRWRCNRRVIEGKKLCHIHHLQGKHRQHKRKVPEYLKIQRKSKLPISRNDKIAPLSIISKNIKKKKVDKGDLELELLRMVLKREVEKRNKDKNSNNKKKNKRSRSREEKGKEKEEEEEKEKVNGFKEKGSYNSEEDEELTRDLPNGLMAISPPLNKPNHLSNMASSSSFGYSPCNVKIGGEDNAGGSSARRCFRSKNVEPEPVGTLQALPYKRDVTMIRKKRRRCHSCRRSGLPSLIRCSSCQNEFFCLDCIKDQYLDKLDEVKMACPVSCGTCCCKSCLEVQCRDIECKGATDEKNKVDKVLHFHYLICVLLPVLQQIIQDQSIELEIEANIKGQKPAEVEIRQPKVGCSTQCCCNCKTSIADFHRSCPSCSYSLCLSCCRDIFQDSLPGSGKSLASKCSNRRITMRSACTSKWQYGSKCLNSSILLPKRKAPSHNGGIPCPPSGFGGCGDSFLDLTCVFPSSWIKELEISAEEVVGCYDLPEPLDVSSSCSICIEMDHVDNGIKHLQVAATREESNDNYLYSPTTMDIQSDSLEHFQKHWGKGQPVIVRNVLHGESDQSWDPVVMFCTYLKNNVTKSENEQTADCLDWFEVEIGIKQLFMGSFRGPAHSNLWHEKLKLKGWLSSHLFQEHFPAHYAEILHALPLPEYMDPISGVLNIASELPHEILKPDLGPFIYISYGSGENLVQSDTVTKLRYDPYDVVNILVHTTDIPVSTEQLNYIRKLMKKHKERNEANGEAPIEGEDVQDVEMHQMVKKGMQLHKKVARVSWFSAATHEPDAASLRDREMLHEGEQDSYSDSDTDTDTDTEVSKFFFGPVKSSRTTENHKLGGKKTRNTNHFYRENFSESCGAQWDVFRREDVPKLIEYLRRDSNKFNHTYGKRVAHPILDQTFFLDSLHKIRLKEELDIEPWTFEQHVGEAVIIPAGCPYQIRNLKSCVNVVMDFVSPENVPKCIQLIDELRLLPENHKAKVDSLEVKKMAVHSISRAVKEIREVTQIDNWRLSMISHLALLLDIEPWTFEQHVREAGILLAGCHYQIRNLKLKIFNKLWYILYMNGIPLSTTRPGKFSLTTIVVSDSSAIPGSECSTSNCDNWPQMDGDSYVGTHDRKVLWIDTLTCLPGLALSQPDDLLMKRCRITSKAET